MRPTTMLFHAAVLCGSLAGQAVAVEPGPVRPDLEKWWRSGMA